MKIMSIGKSRIITLFVTLVLILTYSVTGGVAFRAENANPQDSQEEAGGSEQGVDNDTQITTPTDEDSANVQNLYITDISPSYTAEATTSASDLTDAQNYYDFIKLLFDVKVDDALVLKECYALVEAKSVEEADALYHEMETSPSIINEYINIATNNVYGEKQESMKNSTDGYTNNDTDIETTAPAIFSGQSFHNTDNPLAKAKFSNLTNVVQGNTDDFVTAFAKSVTPIDDSFRKYQVSIGFNMSQKTKVVSSQPIAVTAILDVSGSMQGQGLIDAQRSLDNLIDKILTPDSNNKLAIITFNSVIGTKIDYTSYQPSASTIEEKLYEKDTSGNYAFGNYEYVGAGNGRYIHDKWGFVDTDSTTGGNYNLMENQDYYVVNPTDFDSDQLFKQVITQIVDHSKDNSEIKAEIEKFTAGGGTNSQLAMKTALEDTKKFAMANPDYKNAIIFISDGAPTYRSYDIYKSSSSIDSGTMDTYKTFAQTYKDGASNPSKESVIKDVGEGRWTNFIFKSSDSQFSCYDFITNPMSTQAVTTGLDDSDSHIADTPDMIMQTSLILEGQYAAGEGYPVYTVACGSAVNNPTTTKVLELMTYPMDAASVQADTHDIKMTSYNYSAPPEKRHYTAKDVKELTSSINSISDSITNVQKVSGVMLEEYINSDVFSYNNDVTITSDGDTATPITVLESPSYSNTNGSIRWSLTDSEGNPIAPGNYTVSFTVTAKQDFAGGRNVLINNGVDSISYNEEDGSLHTRNVASPKVDIPPMVKIGLKAEKEVVWKGEKNKLIPSIIKPDKTVEGYNIPEGWKSSYDLHNFNYTLHETSTPTKYVEISADNLANQNAVEVDCSKNGIQTYSVEAKMKNAPYTLVSNPVTYGVVTGSLTLKLERSGDDSSTKGMHNVITKDAQGKQFNFGADLSTKFSDSRTYIINSDNTYNSRVYVPYGCAPTAINSVSFKLDDAIENAKIATNSDEITQEVLDYASSDLQQSIELFVDNKNLPWFRSWTFMKGVKY